MTRIRHSANAIRRYAGIGSPRARSTAPKLRQRRPRSVIDPDALAAAKAELNALAAGDRPIKRSGLYNTLPATGRCHDCDRPVSGERRYCGPCLVKRGTA